MSAVGSDCPSGKEQFVTRQAAHEHRGFMAASGRSGQMRVFRCEHCGCFHLGHRSRASKKAALRGR